jgi:hypothetical protein
MAVADGGKKAFRVSSVGADDQASGRAPVGGGKAMIRLKGCPKCHGDMHYDPLVEEYVCLQCGLAVEKMPEESLTELLAAGAPSEPPRLDSKTT